MEKGLPHFSLDKAEVETGKPLCLVSNNLPQSVISFPDSCDNNEISASTKDIDNSLFKRSVRPMTMWNRCSYHV